MLKNIFRIKKRRYVCIEINEQQVLKQEPL